MSEQENNWRCKTRGRSVKTLDDLKSRSLVNENGCWIWQRAKCGPGYAQVWDFRIRKNVMAHRFSFSLAKGKIPQNLEVDHICNVRACVNPDHLRLLTRQENLKRRDEGKTHCAKGHLWIKENIYSSKRGKVCKICAKERVTAYQKLHPEKNRVACRKYYHTVVKIRRIEQQNLRNQEGTCGNGASLKLPVPKISENQEFSREISL